jgi:hypothetical protein
MQKAGVAPAKVAVKVVKTVISKNIPDRISKQINRAKVDAAIAATKIPPPDYVYKEPRMPRAKETADAAVKRFLEDRIYDDIPMEKSKIDPARITSMADVHRVIISEQPREFVVSTTEQVKHGSPNFGNIGMDALEGNGYADIKKDRNADLNERIVESPDEPQQMPFNAIKIDLSGGFGNVKELTPQDTPQVPPPPMEEATGKGDNPVEMNSVQKQMLAAMRAQRKAINL